MVKLHEKHIILGKRLRIYDGKGRYLYYPYLQQRKILFKTHETSLSNYTITLELADMEAANEKIVMDKSEDWFNQVILGWDKLISSNNTNDVTVIRKKIEDKSSYFDYKVVELEFH